MTAAIIVVLALLVVCMAAVLRDALQALREGDRLAEAEAKRAAAEARRLEEQRPCARRKTRRRCSPGSTR